MNKTILAYLLALLLAGCAMQPTRSPSAPYEPAFLPPVTTRMPKATQVGQLSSMFPFGSGLVIQCAASDAAMKDKVLTWTNSDAPIKVVAGEIWAGLAGGAVVDAHSRLYAANGMMMGRIEWDHYANPTSANDNFRNLLIPFGTFWTVNTGDTLSLKYACGMDATKQMQSNVMLIFE